MPDLHIDGIEEWVLTRLREDAAARGMTLEQRVIGILERAAFQGASALDAVRALRAKVTPDPTWNAVAEIRAGREERTARILGEDPDEAWAREYRSALVDQTGSERHPRMSDRAAE